MPLAVRYLGMAVSWFGFALSFTLLFLSMRAVLAIGGYCAEGGPYAIETHCPGNSGWMAPVSIYMGLASVALGFFFARGLGASIVLAAWPILFVGLGLNFVQSGVGSGGTESGGLLLGGMFVIMGLAPLAIWMRHRVNRIALVAGTSRIDGTSVGDIVFGPRTRETAAVPPELYAILGVTPPIEPDTEGATDAESDGPALRSIDYLILIPLWLIVALFGVIVGVIWFTD